MLKIDQKLKLDQLKVADHLANYFSTIADGTGGTNVQNLTEDDFGNHGSIKHIAMISALNAASEEFQFKPLDNKLVQEAMKMLNPRKATGYDKIDPRILKVGAEELAPSLTSIFNQSITKEAWVTQWKHGEWVPLFKKEDRQEDKNYRPITVLPCVDKIYEKLLAKQISNFMDIRFNDASALKTAVKPRLWGWLRIGKLSLTVRISSVLASDMSKAFDSVCPALLINKLRAYNFSESALNLMRSYFPQRENRVRVGTVTSDWKMVPKDQLLDPFCGMFFKMIYHFKWGNQAFLCTLMITKSTWVATRVKEW